MKVIHYDKAEVLELALARHISEDLNALIHEYGQATLLVSGGSSPIGLFAKLALSKIAWKRVQIGLIDERFVAPGDEHSNERLVRKHLLRELAAKAQFTGMVYDLDSEERNRQQADTRYRELLRAGNYISVLGMGNDGHTASLFPGDPASETELNNGSESKLLSTRAPAFPKQRISCSKQLILESRKIYLLISGKSKLEVLNEAPEKNLPVSHFMNARNIETYFSEQKL